MTQNKILKPHVVYDLPINKKRIPTKSGQICTDEVDFHRF